MLGVEELKERIKVTATTVECPVKECTKRVEGRRRYLKKEELKRCKCPEHKICISPSTFEYKEEKDNLLWTDEKDMGLLKRIKKFKRESRMTHDNSEDAVTWNVFRYLEKNGLIEKFLRSVIGIEGESAEVIYWSYSPREDKGLELLNTAREKFGEERKRSSEPDLIIKTDRVLVFIEAKLGSGNMTQPSDKDNPKKYETGGNSWFKEAFRSDYKTVAITEKKYELMRFWLLGTWMAQQAGLDFYLINLVPKGREEEIVKLFKKHIKENQKWRFRSLTWESIYRYILAQDEPKDKSPMIRFFKNKTVGYRNGTLQKAFAIT